MEIIWDRVFDGKMDDRAHVTNVFNEHNNKVIRQVPKDRLLVFEAKSGWDPLCEFLSQPVPRSTTRGSIPPRTLENSSPQRSRPN